MRIIIYLGAVLFFATCSNMSDFDKVQEEAINNVFIEIIKKSCGIDVDSMQSLKKFVVVSARFDTLEKADVNLSFENFNLANFINNSQSYDYDFSRFPLINNVEVDFLEKEIIKNRRNLSFIKTIHYKNNELYGTNYCKSIIFSQPIILERRHSNFEILVKAVRYYEYPIEEFYYLIKIENKKSSFEQLEVRKNRIIHY